MSTLLFDPQLGCDIEKDATEAEHNHVGNVVSISIKSIEEEVQSVSEHREGTVALV